jgi:ERF superfamily
MEQSTDIGALAEALAKAQGKITGALKDSANPFFKSKYADLASVWDACREQLAANGLAVIQVNGNEAERVTVTTTLIHSSGQWVRGSCSAKPAKDDAQGIGSVITYLRRYGLAAIVGVAQVDDDGEAAVGRKETDKQRVNIAQATQRKFADDARACLANSDVDGLKQLWSEWDSDERVVLWALFNSQERTAMKALKGDA